MDWSAVFNISWPEAIELLKPLAVFIGVIAAFCIFVFIFSAFVARRDFFGAGGKYDELKESFPKNPIITAVQYVLFFPIMVFFWAVVFFAMLMFLAPPSQSMQTTLAVAIAAVGVIRITAYLSEEYAAEMAKLVPLTVLVIFMLDVQLFSFWSSLDAIKAAAENPLLWRTLIYFLFFIIAMEFLLRLAYTAVRILVEARQKRAEAEAERQVAHHRAKEEADRKEEENKQKKEIRDTNNLCGLL